jgi:circadian clock protein KaiB
MDDTDPKTKFERALEEAQVRKVQLRLFIAGMTPRSTQAVADLKRLVDGFFGEHCSVEVVDIYERPEAAAEAQVIAVPTLMRELPLPQQRLIGSIANTAKVAESLGLAAESPESDR